MPVPASPETAEIQIAGMMCLECRHTCEEALTQVTGVRKVEFDESRHLVIVSVEAEGFDMKELISAVEYRGFKVTSLSRRSSGS